jgi:diguanylate cyclase (GGDEF)-like protein
MQLSIGKLVTTLIVLLIAVTVVTTGAGLFVVQSNYRSLEQRHEAEARDSLRNAAMAIRNQVRFYQGVLQLIGSNPQLSNLVEFGEAPEIVTWAQTVGRLLPGNLGIALAGPDGVVFGDPLTLRVGPACQADMRDYSDGREISYPLLHTGIAGLEHFDLVARITAPNGDPTGTLFVSFRLSVLEDLLANIAGESDHFVLLGGDGQEKLSIGAEPRGPASSHYRTGVPDTAWTLILQRPAPPQQSMIGELLLIDSLIVLGVGVLIAWLIRGTLSRFKIDLLRIHHALDDVLRGEYRPSPAPTAIKETSMLLPDIEELALQIQQQRDELRHQSLSDPLTGVFNRRYFDLMLAHLHEQSRRQPPSTLIIVDLNDFKHVNDEFGHSAGDRVLQSAARYLRSRIRASDIVTRVGGDEFALILSHMSNDTLEEWLTALVHDYDHRSLEEIGDSALVCQFSIGVATIDAELYPTAEDVFRAADEAMYAVKQRRDIRHSRYAIARPGNVKILPAKRDTP